MKKFLTVLLALSVVFTYTVGTAFAAEPKVYTADEYYSALNTEKTTQLGYLASDLQQIVDTLGYEKVENDDYSNAAYAASAADALNAFETSMNTVMRNITDTIPADGTTVEPSTKFADLVNVAYEGKITNFYATFGEVLKGRDTTYTAAFLQDLIIKGNKEVLNKTQAGISLKDLNDAIDEIDISKYPTAEKNYTIGSVKVTAAEYVDYLIETAKGEITAAEKFTDEAKWKAYKKAKKDLEDNLETVNTIEDEEIADGEAGKDVVGAVNAYLASALDAPTGYYNALKLVADDVVDPDLLVAPFYDAKAKTLFGIKVANVDKVTKAEATAVNNAFYSEITKSAEVVKVYANNDATKVPSLHATKAAFLQTLGNAMQVAEKYEEVVALGETYKSTTVFGVKKYDDEKVDAAVAKAKELVYGDLNEPKLDSAANYLDRAATELGYDDLLAVNYEYDRFLAAIADAKAKIYKDVAKKTPQTKVSYGADKTPEADLVYLQETYVATEAKAWIVIADAAIVALDNSESYADIDAALAEAATEFGKLMLKSDADAVKDAKAAYNAALSGYMNEQKPFTDSNNFTKNQFNLALNKGKALINKAKSVEGVKEAFAEAKKLIDAVKTDEEIDNAKDALVKQINELPLYANITVADKAVIDAAYEAYAEYVEIPGASATDITNSAILKNALNKVYDLLKDELQDKVDDFTAEINKINAVSDAGAAALVAKKAEIQAMVDEVAAFNDRLDDIKIAGFVVTDVNATVLEGKLGANHAVWNAELHTVAAAILAATKDGATTADREAALDAYNNLTDRQKYALDANSLELLKVVKAKLINAVESMKVVKAHSAAGKGYIKVMWDVVGDETAIDGFQVYKSTKAQSGYTFMGKTTKHYMTNKKGLKKGKRFYYKVRAYKVIDGTKYFSDWSNKANRIYK